MAEAAADFQQIGFYREGAFDETPSSEAIQLVNITSESLGHDLDTIRSALLSADGQDVDVIIQDVGASGEVQSQLQYDNAGWDDVLEASLRADSTWSAAVTNTGTFTLTGTALTGTGVLTGIVVGDIIRIKDGATEIGYAGVATKASDASGTIDRALTNIVADGDEEVELGGFIENGKTLVSYGWEQELTEFAPDPSVYKLVTGMVCNSARWAVNRQRGIVETSYSFLGAQQLASRTTTADAGAPAAATTNPVFNTQGNVLYVVHGSGADVLASPGVDMVWNNNVRMRTQLGQPQPFGAALGKFRPSGTLELFVDETIATGLEDLAIAQTPSQFYVVLKDDNGNAYTVQYPQIRLGSPRRPAAGENQDVILSQPYEAYKDPVLGYTQRIYRWTV